MGELLVAAMQKKVFLWETVIHLPGLKCYLLCLTPDLINAGGTVKKEDLAVVQRPHGQASLPACRQEVRLDRATHTQQFMRKNYQPLISVGSVGNYLDEWIVIDYFAGCIGSLVLFNIIELVVCSIFIDGFLNFSREANRRVLRKYLSADRA